MRIADTSVYWFTHLAITPRSGTIDYTITRSRITPAGIRESQHALKLARARHTAMSSLSLPSNKTAADMALARQKRAEALVEQAEGVYSAISGSKSPQEREAPSDGILPPHGKQYAPTQKINWRPASPHTLKIRQLARESGRRYVQRMKAVRGKKPVVYFPSKGMTKP